MKRAMKKGVRYAKSILCAVLAVTTVLLTAGCKSVAEVEAEKESRNQSSAVSGGGTPVYKYKMAMYNEGPWHVPTESLEYYKKKFPDMEFELVYVEKANASEKINLLISSGDVPDVMQMIDDSKDTLFRQGALGGWTEEFFRENAPNLSKLIDETDPMAWEYAKYDGENMYSIPGWNVNRTYPEVSVYNKAWLDKVGEEIPKTLEDAERVFYKFVNDDPNGNGKKDTYALSEQGFKPIYGAFGMQREMWLEDESGKLVYGDVMPEAKEALALLSKWYKDGVIDPEFITGEAEGGYWALSQPLNKGKIGFTNAGWFYHWSPAGTIKQEDGSNLQEFKALNPKGELAYGVPLVGPEGKPGHKHEQPMVFRTHFSKALCDDKDRFGRLLKFIDYVNASDIAGDMTPVNINTYGEEGTEWEYKTAASGAKIIQSLVTEKGEMSFRGWTGTFHFIEEGGSLAFQKQKSDMTWADEVTKDYPESYYNHLYKTLASAGQYKAELDKLLDEGYISIITGEAPIDYFDEMVKLWYENGGQKMTDEANEWYQSNKKAD